MCTLRREGKGRGGTGTGCHLAFFLSPSPSAPPLASPEQREINEIHQISFFLVEIRFPRSACIEVALRVD